MSRCGDRITDSVVLDTPSSVLACSVLGESIEKGSHYCLKTVAACNSLSRLIVMIFRRAKRQLGCVPLNISQPNRFPNACSSSQCGNATVMFYLSSYGPSPSLCVFVSYPFQSRPETW